VKELKDAVCHRSSDSVEEWNPVKELKVFPDAKKHVKPVEWNPVKELKDITCTLTRVSANLLEVESGEGIESSGRQRRWERSLIGRGIR